MDVKELYRIKKVSDSLVVIFSTTYINPISYLPTIEEDLGKINYCGRIIFDILLTNGHSFNRFAEAIVQNGKFDRKSFKLIEYSSLNYSVLRKIDAFYKANSYLVTTNHVLLEDEKRYLINA
jgi:Antitoxin to bacterial toxin RNase LS or RnlA